MLRLIVCNWIVHCNSKWGVLGIWRQYNKMKLSIIFFPQKNFIAFIQFVLCSNWFVCHTHTHTQNKWHMFISLFYRPCHHLEYAIFSLVYILFYHSTIHNDSMCTHVCMCLRFSTHVYISFSTLHWLTSK